MNNTSERSSPSLLTSYLKKPVFPDEDSRILFTDWLEKHDHITPKWISREDWENNGSIYLQEEIEDNQREMNNSRVSTQLGRYTLFLPEDMYIGELIQMIDIFRRTLSLEEDGYIKFLKESLIRLRVVGFEERELQSLQEEYHISPHLIKKIEAMRFSFSQIRSLITQTRKYTHGTLDRQNESSNNNPLDIGRSAQIRVLDEIVSKGTLQLDTAVWERGRDLIRYGLRTITREWQGSLRKKLQEEGYKGQGLLKSLFEKIFRRGGYEEWKKGQNFLNLLKLPDNELDIVERNFRDVIQVEKYKESIAHARQIGNTEEVVRLEREFVDLLLEKMYIFPYRITEDNAGYYPRGILDFREIYCIGFAIIGHAFLSEVGIEHSALSSSDHLALSVTLGGREYYLDPTGYDRLSPIIWGKSSGVYRKLHLEGSSYTDRVFSGDPSTLIQRAIHNNRILAYQKLGEYKLALKSVNTVLEFNPNDPNLLQARAETYKKLGEYELAFRDAIRVINLDPNNRILYKLCAEIYYQQLSK